METKKTSYYIVFAIVLLFAAGSAIYRAMNPLDETKVDNTPVAPVVTTPAPAPGIDIVAGKNDLAGTKWTLVSVNDAAGAVTPIKQLNKFTLDFKMDGIGIATDCNMAGSDYTAAAGILKLGPIMSTLMACEGADESTYIQIFERAEKYTVSDTKLVITTSQGYSLSYAKIQ
jgi:heat shock protein HslJ